MADSEFDAIDDIPPPPPASRQSWLRNLLVGVLKIVFLVGIFWYLFSTKRLKLEDLQLLAQRWDLALLAMAMSIPAVLVCSLRYKLLLRAFNINSRFSDIVALSMIGMLFDLVSPVSNGGDFVKAGYLSKANREATGHAHFGLMLFSVFLDRIIGLFALFTFALAVCVVAWPQIGGSPELRKTAMLVVVACLVGLLGFFVLVSEKLEKSALRKRLMHIIPFHEKIERVYSGFAGLRHHKIILLQMLGLSLLNHACSCTAILILTQSMTFTSTITNLPAPLEWLPCLTVLPLGFFMTMFGPAGGLGGGNWGFDFLFANVLNLKGGAELVLHFQICSIFFRLIGVPVYIFYKHKGANLDTAPNVA